MHLLFVTPRHVFSYSGGVSLTLDLDKDHLVNKKYTSSQAEGNQNSVNQSDLYKKRK